MNYRMFNIVGTDGSWFSPFGWRARAPALRGKAAVEWVDVPLHRQRSVLEPYAAATTPLLVGDGGEEITSSVEIARTLQPELFPEELADAIEALNARFDRDHQIPGFAAFAADYFLNGVSSGPDEPIMRSIVERATGRPVVEDAAEREDLVASFRASLHEFEGRLEDSAWLFGGAPTYGDVLLFSCLKCFATVLRGVDGVLGEDEFPFLRRWYGDFHREFRIEDPY